jgi:hypothetical protein
MKPCNGFYFIKFNHEKVIAIFLGKCINDPLKNSLNVDLLIIDIGDL